MALGIVGVKFMLVSMSVPSVTRPGQAGARGEGK